ncbi:acyl-CoA dehydrogenase family protein [Streptomyces sp. NPDC126499]|uniref:acyl-CoA dehydrogenase family protein n=1 Tax=Streptomyces sp. NPDC126499 TaxID=3155314 RepID=UPI0033295DE3
MDLTPDPLLVRLRTAVRTSLAGVPVRPEVHGAPVTDGARGPARTVLDELEAADFERPLAAGGLDLGLTAGVLVSEELGRAACGNAYRGDALAADVGGPAGAAAAGFEALPAGTGVTATPRPGGWALTGTATVDDAAPATLLVATRTDDGPVLVAVAADAPGVRVEPGCWPPVVRFEATPVTAADVVGRLDDAPAGPLARARLRQAAYLLGIADGAHQIAVRYAGVRRQFDTRLRDLPAVAFPLARGMVALRATRAAVYRGAWLIDAGPGTGTGTGAGTGAGAGADLGSGPDLGSGTGAGPVLGSGTGSGSDLDSGFGSGFGSGEDVDGTAPVVALAMAAETAREVVRSSMQSCGVRAMTTELGLHRYFRLAAAESVRYGEPAALWRLVGAARLDRARRAARRPAPARTAEPA